MRGDEEYSNMSDLKSLCKFIDVVQQFFAKEILKSNNDILCIDIVKSIVIDYL